MVIHPLLTHFPIALLLAGSLTLVWQTVTHKENSAIVPFVDGALGLGYAGLLMTVATGLFDMQNSPKTNAKEGWLLFAVLHIIAGVSLVLVYGIMLFRRFVSLAADLKDEEIRKVDQLALVLNIVGIILLVAVGWLGGHIVYEYRVGIG